MLYRTNAQSRALEEALRRHGVPYRLVGAVRFYDRREIRDLMAYLKLIANPADDEAFRRAVAVPKRGLGETTIEQLAEAARERGVPMLEAAAATGCASPRCVRRRAPRSPSSSRLIAALARARAEAAVDELLGSSSRRFATATTSAPKGPNRPERLDNVRELITGAAELVADELGEVGLRRSIISSSARCSSPTSTRSTRTPTPSR